MGGNHAAMGGNHSAMGGKHGGLATRLIVSRLNEYCMFIEHGFDK